MQPGASGKAAVAVVLDGKPIGAARGADVDPDAVARFERSGMLRVVARAPRGKHVLTLVANDPGLRVYVFTFGP
jgi:Thioredoxin like C-terminal domain